MWIHFSICMDGYVVSEIIVSADDFFEALWATGAHLLVA